MMCKGITLILCVMFYTPFSVYPTAVSACITPSDLKMTSSFMYFLDLQPTVFGLALGLQVSPRYIPFGR
jgi:hypothetical protein